MDDFGSQGEWPTHAELLDWLASEFKHPEWQSQGAHDWDMKHTVRTIVMSHTYRQSSLPTPEIDAKDPENRLLGRGPRFRLSAEEVRDQALAISGDRPCDDACNDRVDDWVAKSAVGRFAGLLTRSRA